jgi:hypothetical protein
MFKTEQPTADGEKAVAVTTQISDEGVWLGGWNFFGLKLPESIVRCELIRDYMWDVVNVHWVLPSGETHSAPFEQTPEGVIAAVVAMKLTC